jgi:predicted PurR-regulated permease PerM
MTPPPAPLLVPRWLDRLGAIGWRLLAAVALAVVIGLVAAELATVTASIVVALLAVLAILPVYRRIRSQGASSTAAAAYACGIGALLLVLVVLLLAVAVLPHLTAVTTAVTDGIEDLRASLADLGLPAWLADTVDRILNAIDGVIDFNVAALVAPVANAVTVGILAAFLSYFLLADGAKGWAWAMQHFQPWQAEAVTAAATKGVARVSGYLGRTAILAAVDGAVVFAVLVALGVGIAGPLSALAFVGGFIPFLGGITATGLIALAVLALVGPWAALAVVVAVVASGWIATRLLDGTQFGRHVDVGSLLVLLVIPAGLALFGPLGLFAVLPLVVFAAAVFRAIVVALGLGPANGALAPDEDGAVPVWLDRLGQWSWRGLVVFGLVWLVIQILIAMPLVIIPLTLAGVLAATLGPVVSWMVARGLSNGIATSITIVTAVIATVAAVVASIAYSVGPLQDIIEAAIDGAEQTGVELIAGVARAIAAGLLANLADLVRGTISIFVVLLMTLLITFFLLRDGGRLWQRLLDRLAPGRRPQVERIGDDSVGILSGYMVGTAIISAFGAVTTWGILWLLGLPLGLPIAVFSFAAGFIPYIGSFLSTALSTLVAVALGEPIDVVVMLIWTVVFNIVQGNFVTPLVYGRTMSLHPAIILLAIPAGGEIAGILGMFLIVPSLAIFGAVLRPALDLIADTSPLTAEREPLAGSGAASA